MLPYLVIMTALMFGFLGTDVTSRPANYASINLNADQLLLPKSIDENITTRMAPRFLQQIEVDSSDPLHQQLMSADVTKLVASQDKIQAIHEQSARKPYKWMHEAFFCPKVPSSIPLPFPWFCHESLENVTMESPGGRIQLEHLGQIHGTGPHLYHYSVKPTHVGTARILYNGKFLASFEAKSEACNCPKQFQEFTESFNCSADDLERLDRYFDWWLPKSVSLDIFNDTLRYARGSLSRVAIINNELYAHKISSNEGWENREWNALKTLLGSVLRKVELPDVEFYVHVHDKPFLAEHMMGAPVFGYVTDPLHRDIPLPCNDHIKEAFSGHSLRRFATKGKPWEQRKGKAYFRGSYNAHYKVDKVNKITFRQRFRAALIGKQRPELFDVLLSLKEKINLDRAVMDWAVEEKLGCAGCKDRKEKNMDYKYVLDLDGVSAPYRTSALLSMGGLVVKPKSPFAQFFSGDFVPDKHFLQVEETLADLVKAITWATKHDDEAKLIAQDGLTFFSTRLRQEDILCWTAHALQKLQEGLAFKPEIREGMRKVKLQHTTKCRC